MEFVELDIIKYCIIMVRYGKAWCVLLYVIVLETLLSIYGMVWNGMAHSTIWYAL